MNAEALKNKVEELANRFLSDEKNVGLAVGVLRGGERHFFGFGKLARDSDRKPDEHTVFEIGSITKVFTAQLLADMQHRGEVQLQDPVQRHLPDAVHMPRYGEQEVTLFHLSTHTSSLPPMPGNWEQTVKDEANPYADYTVDHLYEVLPKTRLRRPVGNANEYSNFGVGLLGHTLALKLGTSYEDAILQRICRPLELFDTAITLSEDQKHRLAQGHAEGKPTSNWDIKTLAGAGALRSTISELAKYADANLHPEKTPVQAALETCFVRHRLPTAWSAVMSGFLLAIGWGLLSIVLQYLFAISPGGFVFFIVTSFPAFLSTVRDGVVPGALAMAITLAGAYTLWHPDINIRSGFFGLTGMITLLGLVRQPVFGTNRWIASLSPSDVCLGWATLPLGNDVVYWHNGGTGGFRSFLGLLRNKDLAIILLANSDSDVDPLAVELLEFCQSE